MLAGKQQQQAAPDFRHCSLHLLSQIGIVDLEGNPHLQHLVSLFALQVHGKGVERDEYGDVGNRLVRFFFVTRRLPFHEIPGDSPCQGRRNDGSSHNDQQLLFGLGRRGFCSRLFIFSGHTRFLEGLSEPQAKVSTKPWVWSMEMDLGPCCTEDTSTAPRPDEEDGLLPSPEYPL